MSRLYFQQKMSRRHFAKLLGLGAGSLLLGSARTALASGMAPKRCLVFMEGNGVLARFLSSQTVIDTINANGGTIAPDDYEVYYRSYNHSVPLEIQNASLSSAPALGSLASQGSGDPSIEEDARVILGLSSQVSGGGHSSYFGALTCSPGSRRSPSTASIDHILASNPLVRRGSPFDAIRLGIDSNIRTDFNYQTCSTGLNSPAPLICDATKAYKNLFSAVTPNGGDRFFNNQQQLLEFALQDANLALSRDIDSATRDKFERYAEGIETLQARNQQILAIQDELQAVRPQGPGESSLYDSGRSLDQLEVMTELAVSSLIGGLSNVAVIGSGTGGHFNLNYARIGYGGIGRHDLCHGENYTALEAITEFHVQMVSRIAKRLKQIPEEGGSMLDNTAIIFMSDNGEKHHSTAGEWPILMIGGNNLGFGPGNTAHVYPRDGLTGNRQLSNLFSTLTFAMGAGIENFGNDVERVASGPLGEIWSA